MFFAMKQNNDNNNNNSVRSIATQTENSACTDICIYAENIVKNFHKIETHWKKVQKRSYIALACALGLTFVAIVQRK